MLYRVIIDNYKSFAEETAFDLFPNPKGKHSLIMYMVRVLHLC